MPMPSKDITCKCGHVSTLQTRKLLCTNCGKYVFYNAKEKRRHTMNTYYVLAMFLLAFGILAFLFMEMIAEPLLSGKAVRPQ